MGETFVTSKRTLTEADILPPAEYAKNRTDHRRRVGAKKRNRRVEVGPGGRLLAEVETPCLVVADGAVLEGPCRMVKGE